MHRAAPSADRAQKERIEAFRHERAPEGDHHRKRNDTDAADQSERLIVQRQHRAEQNVHQVDAGATP